MFAYGYTTVLNLYLQCWKWVEIGKFVSTKTSIQHKILGKVFMPLHNVRNAVVHLYYSFQLRSLAVAWQSDKLEGANFSEISQSYFLRFWRTL